MKYIKMLSLMSVATAALLAFVGTASATILTNGSGGTYSKGTVFHAQAEGTVVLHMPIGDIECTESTLEAEITDPGSASTTVSGSLRSLTFGKCNATVDVLKLGTLEFHTRTANADGNSTVTSNGLEITVVFSGFHCIITTSNTDIGTLTGSKTGDATIDVEATIPRTGGSAFCGSTAQWTGSYKVDKPTPLYAE